MAERKCLCCGVPLERIVCSTLQLGKTSWIFGDLPNLLSGGLDVMIMSCPQCGRIELFQPTDEDRHVTQSKVTCPECGKQSALGTHRCPNCGHAFY